MDLDPVEQRILGSLLEKQVTVPASYPLTLSSLRSACNQTSSRDPVMDLDEQTVEATARGLKDRGLLRIVWSDSGRRTLKYHQTLAETLELADDERALITVLLLRGPQAPGELRTRTERLHPFADRAQVEDLLRPDGRPRRTAGAPARATTRAAGPPLGAPARPGRDGGGRTGSGRGRPGGPDRRLARPRATTGCGRRTASWRRATRRTSRTSWTGSRSSAGCSTAWSRRPVTCRSSTPAAGPATSRRTSPTPARTPAAWTSRRRWSTRPGSATRASATTSATSGP